MQGYWKASKNKFRKADVNSDIFFLPEAGDWGYFVTTIFISKLTMIEPKNKAEHGSFTTGLRLSTDT